MKWNFPLRWALEDSMPRDFSARVAPDFVYETEELSVQGEQVTGDPIRSPFEGQCMGV